jgi:hypothetical protein
MTDLYPLTWFVLRVGLTNFVPGMVLNDDALFTIPQVTMYVTYHTRQIQIFLHTKIRQQKNEIFFLQNNLSNNEITVVSF